MFIEIEKKDNKVLLECFPDDFHEPDLHWLLDKLDDEDIFILSKCFTLTKENLDSYDEQNFSYVYFLLSDYTTINEKNYFKIKKDILQIDFDLFFEESCDISRDYFLTERKTSIFKIINEINIGNSLFIGGEEENSITEAQYFDILIALPNSYEHQLYDKARVESVLRNFFCPEKDIDTQFSKYINTKKIKNTDLSPIHFEDFDIQRYTFLLSQLEYMLSNEIKYSENDWQNEILKFIKILFPKYVISVKEAIIKKGIADKNKHIDILLGDYNGNVDIIEIKKPYGIELLNKRLYRENYIPTKALSGAIMQAEKYIFYLTKGGKKVEDDLNKQFAKVKPADYTFKVVNPKTLIIMGRTNDYSSEQIEDLEIIRRKYKNVIDIISYDDLIQRLKTTIEMLKKELSNEITKSSH